MIPCITQGMQIISQSAQCYYELHHSTSCFIMSRERRFLFLSSGFSQVKVTHSPLTHPIYKGATRAVHRRVMQVVATASCRRSDTKPRRARIAIRPAPGAVLPARSLLAADHSAARQLARIATNGTMAGGRAECAHPMRARGQRPVGSTIRRAAPGPHPHKAFFVIPSPTSPFPSKQIHRDMTHGLVAQGIHAWCGRAHSTHLRHAARGLVA